MTNTAKQLRFTSSTETCPISRAVRAVGDVWILLIVRNLIDGSKRFTELQEALGHVSSGTLSQRLKLLENEDIITRQAFAEIPPRVEYHLTEKGYALIGVMEALAVFGERYLCDDDEERGEASVG